MISLIYNDNISVGGAHQLVPISRSQPITAGANISLGANITLTCVPAYILTYDVATIAYKSVIYDTKAYKLAIIL